MITLGEARTLATGLLAAAGLPPRRALLSADAIVLADAWGLGSHGLMRLPHYLDRIAAGGYPADADLVSVVDTGPLLVTDGGGGLGHWQLHEAADEAAKRVHQYGIAAVAVGSSGHCGALGVYTLPLLDAGLVGLVFSQGPAVMPPWGGAEPVLSTSPLSIGIPLQPQPAIVDMALSTVARGKVAARAKAGLPVPEGWVVDERGNAITDPATALTGMLAPLGGAKGFALALCVEALTGGLVGPLLSVDVPDMFDPKRNHEPQRVSHLVVAIDPTRTDSTGSPDGASRRLHELAHRIEASGGRIPGNTRCPLSAFSPETRLEVPLSTIADLRRRQSQHR